MELLRDLSMLPFDDVLLFDFSPTPVFCEFLATMLPHRKVVQFSANTDESQSICQGITTRVVVWMPI